MTTPSPYRGKLTPAGVSARSTKRCRRETKRTKWRGVSYNQLNSTDEEYPNGSAAKTMVACRDRFACADDRIGIRILFVGRHTSRPPVSLRSSGESEHSADIRRRSH